MKNLLFIVIVFFMSNVFSYAYDGEYIQLENKYTLKENGDFIYRYYHKIKLNTYSAYSDFGEFFIPYHPEYQKLTIIKAETKTASGKIIPAPEKDPYREYLPEIFSHTGYYNDYKEYIVHHVGLELGCVVELEYEITTKKEFVPFVNIVLPLHKENPIQELLISFTVPKETEVYEYLSGRNEKVELVENGQDKTYSWKFSQLNPCLEKDRFKVCPKEAPVLQISTKKLDFLKEYGQSLFSKKELSAEWVQDCDTIMKKENENLSGIQQIFHFFQSYFTSKEIPFSHLGFQVADFQYIKDRLSGSDFDKWILLYQFLKMKHMEAEPFVTVNENEYNGKFFVWDNVADLGLRIQGIDYTIHGENLTELPYYHLKEKIYLFNIEEISESDKERWGDRNIKIVYTPCNNYPGLYTMKGDMKLKGWERKDILETDSIKIKNIEKKILHGGKIIKNSFQDKSDERSFTFHKDSIVLDTAAEICLCLSLFDNGNILESERIDLLPEAKNLSLPFLFSRTETHEILIPENYLYVGRELEQAFEDNNIKVSVSRKRNKNKIITTKEIKLLNPLIKIEEYKSFRQAYYLYEKEELKKVCLKKVK